MTRERCDDDESGRKGEGETASGAAACGEAEHEAAECSEAYAATDHRRNFEGWWGVGKGRG
jgi:hypothetical protein